MLDKLFLKRYTSISVFFKIVGRMAKDLYEVLGIKRDASDQEIKTAYRKLALQWHPDKHKGEKEAETKFKEINNAYETLSDKQKRQQYDTFGSTGGGGGFGGGGGGFSGGGFDFNGFSGGGGGFADIFESFFGGNAGGGARSSGGRKSGKIRGNDIETQIKISFEDAVFGCEKELEITKPAKCDHCGGNGAEPGSSIVSCKTCSGSGEIRAIRNTILGQVSTTRTCDECSGEGKVPEKVCTSCHGTSRVRKKERVHVKIPAGVDNGSTIRLSGKGESGIKGGPDGDLYLHLLVQASKKFVRSGMDIHSEVNLHVLQAIMGDEIDVDTLYGSVKIKIAPGTEDGRVFKISDKGVTKIGDTIKGDHLVKVHIEIPKKLSKKEKELYEELAGEAKLDLKKGGLFW